MMLRRGRRIEGDYTGHFFKPRGIPLSTLDQVSISKDELEVLRLRYIEKKQQLEASEQMGISQSQYQRDMVKALEKIVDALIGGKAIRIDE